MHAHKEPQVYGSKKTVSRDRRQLSRDPVLILAFCYYEFRGIRDPAVVLNYSDVGISIRCSEPLDIGRELKLQFQSATTPLLLEIEGKVIWSDGRAQAGIEFLGKSCQRWKDWLKSEARAAYRVASGT